MKVILIGLVESSSVALNALLEDSVELVGVVTKSKTQFNNDYYDLSNVCKKHKIDMLYVDNINDQNSELWIKDKNPDLIYCIGWSQIIKKNILDIPQKGVIGFHPAALPQNRGRHPIVWALVLGLDTTASSLFLMDEDIDTGKILSQVTLPIEYSDTARELYNKILNVLPQQIKAINTMFSQNKVRYIEPKLDKSNSWRKRSKLDGEIDFRMTSNAIYNLVRGLTHPYVGAHCNYNDVDYKIWACREIKCFEKNLEPGKVIERNNEINTFTVKTYDGAVEFIDHDFIKLPEVGEYIS